MAGFKVGSTDFSTVKVGSTQVEAIYVGETAVWNNFQAPTIALSGTYTTSDVGNMRYVRFTGSGTFNMTSLGSATNITYAVVGGGGGAGSNGEQHLVAGGGGGAVAQGTFTATGSRSITIGSGGVWNSTDNQTNSFYGGTSSISGIASASGGGNGGVGNDYLGGSSGSGYTGGSSFLDVDPPFGSGTYYYGYGGGAGASANGGNAYYGGYPGNGGAGVTLSNFGPYNQGVGGGGGGGSTRNTRGSAWGGSYGRGATPGVYQGINGNAGAVFFAYQIAA